MTSQEINAQISAIDKALASQYTPEGLKPKLEAKKKELQALTVEVKEIRQREKKIKNTALKPALKTEKKKVEKKSATIKSEVKDLLAEVKQKIAEFNQGRSKSSIAKDAQTKANAPGKQVSRSGKTYYESRPGHTDISPENKLKNGGVARMANGGRIKSALMRDRKYTSQQEWEKDYKRKSYNYYKADGGMIDTEYYENNTAAELWGGWTKEQRRHFLLDHFEDEFANKSADELDEVCKKPYDDLWEETQSAIEMHRKQGQYDKGGPISNSDFVESELYPGYYTIGKDDGNSPLYSIEEKEFLKRGCEIDMEMRVSRTSKEKMESYQKEKKYETVLAFSENEFGGNWRLWKVKGAGNILVFGYQTQFFYECPAAADAISKAAEKIANESKGKNYTQHFSALVALTEVLDTLFALKAEMIEPDFEALDNKQIASLTQNLLLAGIYNYKTGSVVNMSFLNDCMAQLINR